MKQVALCDVGPRDGLQSEPVVLAPAVRAELANRLAATGVARVEAASFVRDELVPQMAGAEQRNAGSSVDEGVAKWLEGARHPLPGRVYRAGRWVAKWLEGARHPLPGRVYRAGRWP